MRYNVLNMPLAPLWAVPGAPLVPGVSLDASAPVATAGARLFAAPPIPSPILPPLRALMRG